jgi:FAD:protein FMN transferase
MGTDVEVVTDVVAAGVEVDVSALFEAWEQALSRFRADSEVSRLNAGSGRPFAAGPILLQAVVAACEAARRTRGLFDPTLVDQLEAAGYDRTFAEVAPEQPRRELPARPGGGWREIEVDLARETVTLPPGTRIEFGGIGKGLAVDAAVDLLRARGVGCAAVDAGGDLSVLGVPPGAESWPVAVETGEEDETVSLHRGALATSSTLGRRWFQGAALRHHLIDPRDGRPAAGGVRSVTVAAPTCERAEIDAKVALLLGAGLAIDYLERSAVTGLVVLDDGRRLRAAGWPGA